MPSQRFGYGAMVDVVPHLFRRFHRWVVADQRHRADEVDRLRFKLAQMVEFVARRSLARRARLCGR